MTESHLSLADIAALEPIPDIYGKPIAQVIREANRICAAAGIEFGESELSFTGHYDPDCPATFTGYRWIECSAVRGSNEGFYIHVRLVPRVGDKTFLIATAKTWTWESALEISAAVTRILGDW